MKGRGRSDHDPQDPAAHSPFAYNNCLLERPRRSSPMPNHHAKSPPNPCSFCNGHHFNDHCPTYTTIADRMAAADRRETCHRCLVPVKLQTHRRHTDPAYCFSKHRPCYYCTSLDHHSALCPVSGGGGGLIIANAYRKGRRCPPMIFGKFSKCSPKFYLFCSNLQLFSLFYSNFLQNFRKAQLVTFVWTDEKWRTIHP